MESLVTADAGTGWGLQGTLSSLTSSAEAVLGRGPSSLPPPCCPHGSIWRTRITDLGGSCLDWVRTPASHHLLWH